MRDKLNGIREPVPAAAFQTREEKIAEIWAEI
jgi:hypothetical protein